MSYHPLHATGTITIKDIAREKGHCGITDEPTLSRLTTLRNMALALDDIPLNRNPAVNTPDLIAKIEKTGIYADLSLYPYKLSDWYGYNHIGGSLYTTETELLGRNGSERYLYQLMRTHKKSLLLEDLTSVLNRRMCFRQQDNLNETRNNNISIPEGTTNAAVSEISVSVSHDTEMINSISSFTRCTIERGVIKIATKEYANYTYSLSSTRSISNIQIKLNGLSGDVGESLCLVYYRPQHNSDWSNPTSEVTEFDWWGTNQKILGLWVRPEAEFSTNLKPIEVSDIVPYTNGEIIFTLNADGREMLRKARSNKYEFIYFEILFKTWDYDATMHWGDNLVTGSNYSFAGGNNWQVLRDGLYDGTFNVLYGAYEGRTNAAYLNYYTASSSVSDSTLGITLSKAYISGWESLSGIPYYDDHGYSTNMYTTVFDYKWEDQPIESLFTLPLILGLKSHMHINGDHIGCGPFILPLQTSWYTGNVSGIFNNVDGDVWNTAIYSENIPALGSSQTNNGIALYIIYGLLFRGTISSSLFLDNFGLYKSYYYKKLNTHFMFTANPTMIVTWKVVNQVPTIADITLGELQKTSANITAGITKSHSSVVAMGIVVKAWGIPTISDYTKIVYQSIPTSPGIIDGYMLNINGLVAGTTYYAKVFAINWAGTGYSSTLSFTTPT